jgi:GNAT superfamily N-acetyltransferase
MQHSWFIRVYQKGDEEGIFDLWEAVYPSKERRRNEWMMWWDWMYNQSPEGSKIWVAEDNGKIVGQFACILTNLKVGKAVKKAALSVDTMTHPDYRHQGLMSTLERKGIDELAKASVDMIYGFPNESSYPMDLKIGFFSVASLRSMVMIFNWKNVLRTRISNNFLLALGTTASKVLNKILVRNC